MIKNWWDGAKPGEQPVEFRDGPQGFVDDRFKFAVRPLWAKS